MATFRRVGNKWQCIVRRKGHKPVTKTFSSKTDGDKWARLTESAMDCGTYAEKHSTITLATLIDRYIAEVSPLKRSARQDIQRMRYLRHHLGHLIASQVRSQHIALWRDQRLKAGKAGATVVKEINNLSHLMDTAIREWGVPLISNPVKFVRKPKQARGRDRRVTAEELSALQQTTIAPIVTLAIETGMRLGELLSLSWSTINFVERTATLSLTKNGEKRIVPLSPVALETLERMERKTERVFSQWRSSNGFRSAWKRALSALQRTNSVGTFLRDLRFHDLRHEAASRLFEKGLNVMEVSTITGHKTLAMLKRYTHLRATDIAQKLANTTTNVYR